MLEMSDIKKRERDKFGSKGSLRMGGLKIVYNMW